MVDIIGALYDMEGISKVVAETSEIRRKSVNMIACTAFTYMIYMPDMSRVVRPLK